MNSIRNLTRHAVASFVLLALTSACSTNQTLAPPLPNDIAGEMHHLAYDVLAVNVETSIESEQTLGVEGGGQAAKEGFKLMGQAPIGCLGAGMYAGLCYAMMPIFPIITAVRAEDPEIAREELGEFYARIEDYDLHATLESRLLERMAVENLPAVEPGSVGPGNRLITVNVYTSPMELQHSGYKKGYIDVTLPYTIELTDGSGKTLARKSGKASEDFARSSRSTTLYPKLDQWLETIVETSIGKMLLEWQPEVTLGYTHPNKVEKMTWLGRKYLDWAPVDTLTPQLEWQGLEELIPPERMSEITDVTYELEVFGYGLEMGDYPYKRRTISKLAGLSAAAYQLEEELLPCQRYYWEAKARFFYRGAMRTTTFPQKYELKTSGPDCKMPRYLLPEIPALEGSIVGP
ncbi:MAG: hypothetical protein O3A13_13605 [Proteobacteria bacterium]|nr:hypothetical protein [Pseudomonadota bacterium]